MKNKPMESSQQLVLLHTVIV